MSVWLLHAHETRAIMSPSPQQKKLWPDVRVRHNSRSKAATAQFAAFFIAPVMAVLLEWRKPCRFSPRELSGLSHPTALPPNVRVCWQSFYTTRRPIMAKPLTLPATDETSVFVNQDGGLSITQDHLNGDDLVIVALSRSQARLVAAEIIRLDGDDELWQKEGQE